MNQLARTIPEDIELSPNASAMSLQSVIRSCYLHGFKQRDVFEAHCLVNDYVSLSIVTPFWVINHQQSLANVINHHEHTLAIVIKRHHTSSFLIKRHHTSSFVIKRHLTSSVINYIHHINSHRNISCSTIVISWEQ